MKGMRYVLLLGIIGLAFALDISVGSVNIPLVDVARILLGKAPTRATWSTIVLVIRLPRALTAMLAGAALAVSGLQMQTLFRNALAGPFVLGISAGASLGVALFVLGMGPVMREHSPWGQMSLALVAALGAAFVMALVLLMARHVRSRAALLIVGLMVGYVASAVVTVLLYFAQAEDVQTYVIWTFGSFGGVTWPQLRIFAGGVLVGLLLAMGTMKPLNALLLGEAYAMSMGVHVIRARAVIIASAALLAGVVTAFCGPVAFVGVAVPHMARGLLRTSDHRILIPGTLLLGSITALFADVVTSLPGSATTLPLNAVTSLLGAPVIIWIILRRQRMQSVEA